MTTPIRLRYQTIEVGDTDIHLCTLRDKQQFSDPEGEAENLGIFSAFWGLFGVIWPSSVVLANYIVGQQTSGKRILEIGCGTALTSLLLNKQHDDITATDHHPEVEFFLERNALLNDDELIAFERVDWCDAQDQLGHFDLIIGSDLLYEDQHIHQLAAFIEKHAKQSCEVIIVDPGRGRKSKMMAQMNGYGFAGTQHKPTHTDYLEKPFKGHILKFSRDLGPGA